MNDGRSPIHPTAQISRGATLAPGVQVGPFCVIGERVEIGENTRIGPHTVIQGPTRIGRESRIYGQSAIGTDPQDLKYSGEESFLWIGDGNVIREFVTVNRGTAGGGGATRVGDGNLLMTGVHVAHDCRIGNRVILSNAATLAGHVDVGDFATVGAFSGIHQFCRVGRHAFIGGYSVVTLDALPFIRTVGDNRSIKTYGVNRIGLQRKGFSSEQIDTLQKAYRLLFRKKLRLREAISRLEGEGLWSPEVEELVRFIESTERGFIR